MPAALLAEVLAQQLSGFWIEDPDEQLVPLHSNMTSDPARREAIVSGLDFDAAIQMHEALAMLVVTKRFQGERLEERFFFRKHGRDLPFGGAVDAGIGAIRLLTIEIGLRFL